MMTGDGGSRPIDPAVWQREDMRNALARRDIATVFWLLNRKYGISQRGIAARTGQSQSEISEILGGRRVVAYDVLCRIADGFSVPRGRFGLAYDADTAALVGVDQVPVDGDDDTHTLVTRMTLAAMGATAVDTDDWHRPFRNDHRDPPAKLHRYDASRMQCVTAHLRRLDDRFGGAVSRDVVAAHLRTCQALLMSTMDDKTRTVLHVGLAQLHGLAGWTAIDLGQKAPALNHLARAAEHARLAGESSLIAVTLCDAGRLYLHQGDGTRALRLLQLAQMVAVESGHPVAAALCVANLAWAYALCGDAGQATTALDRARIGLVEGVGRSDVVPWLAWFGDADVCALTGTVHVVLPGGDRDHQAVAVEALRASIALRGNDSKRARALQTAVLSRTLFDAGDTDDAVKTGGEAMDLADRVGSARVGDVLRSLRAATGYHQGWPGVSDLGDRITAHIKARRHLYA